MKNTDNLERTTYNLNKLHIGKLMNDKKKNKAYGQLVLLGFAVTSLTPIAYQRHSL